MLLLEYSRYGDEGEVLFQKVEVSFFCSVEMTVNTSTTGFMEGKSGCVLGDEFPGEK